MANSKKKQHQNILSQINSLQARYPMSALVPLDGSPVPGTTLEYLREACAAREEISRLMGSLRKLYSR